MLLAQLLLLNNLGSEHNDSFFSTEAELSSNELLNLHLEHKQALVKKR